MSGQTASVSPPPASLRRLPRREGTAPARGRMALVEPIVPEQLFAQASLGVFTLGETTPLQLGKQMRVELLIGARDGPVDQIDAVDAGLLPFGERIRNLLGRTDQP